MNRVVKKGILLVVVVVVVALAASWLLQGRDGSSGSSFRTTPVKRGDLLASIGATGTVEPEELVDIGAQVAGKIVSFGKDKDGKAVDYGSVVEQDMILAQIDDSLYTADVQTASAQLEQAKAGLARSEADLGQFQANLFKAERDWNRAKKLGPSDALAQADYDAAQSAFDVAKANLAVGKAAVDQARGNVAQSKAALSRAQQNLDYCTIRSPVKGVIIDRRVNIGQTVVSSLNAPSLFLIAKDLNRLQVWVAVNEADIGNIKPGQRVTFTVDAFPGQTFEGEVGKVRLNATMTQNVVTYTVEVVTDNSSGKLLPYLTANVKFIAGNRQNVLMVPNAALRWTPRPDQMAQQAPKGAAPGIPAGATESGSETSTRGVIWIARDGLAMPVPVRAGLSDGSMTEIQSKEIKEGAEVIVGEQVKEAKTGASSEGSPFAPRFFRGGQSK